MKSFESWTILKVDMQRRSQMLFVYGTLRRGFSLHGQITKLGVRYVGKGQIEGRLYDLGKFPGAIPAADSNIEGEVYELPDARRQLAALDEIEEYNSRRPNKSLFVRKRTSVRLRNGRRLRAWVYFLPKRPQKARLILTGNYAEARRAPMASAARAGGPGRARC